MPFEYLTNIPLDEAVKKFLAVLNEHGLTYSTENVPTTSALGRITSRAVYAQICAPHYNACAMDGSPWMPKKPSGNRNYPAAIKRKRILRVDTGDPLPPGCDAVVMIEDVIEDAGFVTLYAAATPWQHIRQIGEDISAGDMILPSFTAITPAGMEPCWQPGSCRWRWSGSRWWGSFPPGMRSCFPPLSRARALSSNLTPPFFPAC